MIRMLTVSIPMVATPVFAGSVPADSAKTGRGAKALPSHTGPADPMSGDEEANARRFKDAVMPHLDDAYTLARYLTRNAQDADDLVQESYLRAFKFFASFKGDHARPWLLTIVRNCFYSALKAHPRSETASLSDMDVDALDTSATVIDLWGQRSENPEQTLITLDNADVVRRLIECLPTQFREVLVLRELEELSYQEIAHIMDVPIGTVMSRLARARNLFKAAWIEHSDKEHRP
jgi:RNA polymerase sigma-70 factor (ECF subfamily)